MDNVDSGFAIQAPSLIWVCAGMYARVADELQGGIRRFQAMVHPDRFLRYPAEVVARNAEAFKIVGSAGTSLCSLLRSDRRPLRHLPFTPRRLQFHLPVPVPSPSPLLSHTLSFDGQVDAVVASEDQPAITWQEAALSVLHLLAKAHVEHDQRITRWLLSTHDADPAKEQSPHPLSEETEVFSNLLQQHQLDNDPVPLQSTKDLDNVRLSRDLSPEGARAAVRSVWECRDIFRKLQQIRPETRFVITDHGLPPSSRTVCLTTRFSPLDLTRYLSF